MSTGMWVNNDGLPLQYGVQKTFPEAGGDFLSYGDTREVEVRIDLTTLSTSPVMQSMTTLFPSGSNIVVEQVEVYTETGATGGTSFSVGLGYITSSPTYTTVTPTFDGVTWSLSLPSMTAISSTAFVNAMVTADVTTAGQKTILNEGSTYAGGYIGSTSSTTTHPNFITALAAGTFTAGVVRVRIKYRGIGTIAY